MKPQHQAFASFTFLLAFIASIAAIVPAVQAKADNKLDPLIGKMIGTWKVQQRMWPSPGSDAIELQPAIAKRDIVGGVFLKEEMLPARGTEGQPFSRVAFFNYNAVNRQYEYFSMDSRVPQMMTETSLDADIHKKLQQLGEITLFGGSFVAPKWGETSNAAFRYRLVIGDVERDRQLLQLFLTPQSAGNVGEFLAFEYVYSRQRQ